MRSTRKLALRRETLAQLTTGDMNAVVGGSHGCPTANCTTVTHGPSLDEPCPTPTLPVLICTFTLISCQAC